jgi:hypothetical protein
MGLYTRFRALWADGEAGGTPITAAALNYIEDGIVAASDHGQLAGLADDDHPQYLLRDDAIAAYETLIADTTLAAAAGSVVFSSIPQTYRHLRLVLTARGDLTGTGPQRVLMRMNADSGAGYHWQYMRGNATTPTTGAFIGASSIGVGLLTVAGSAADNWATTEVVLPDYRSATHRKQVQASTGGMMTDETAGLFLEQSTGIWRNLSAITSLTLFPSGGNFIAGTRATLYGMKGA